MLAEAAAKADEERGGRRRRGGGASGAARRRGRRGGRGGGGRRGARARTAAEERAPRCSTERRALEAEVDHLRAALRDLQDVGAEVLQVAGAYPGTVSLAGRHHL